MCKIKQERLLKLNEYLKGLKVSKWDTKTVTNRRYRTTTRSLLGLLAKIIIKIKNCYLLKDICWGWLFQRTPSAHLPVPGLESHLYFQSYLPANVHPAKVQVIPAGVLEAPSPWRPRLNSKPGKARLKCQGTAGSEPTEGPSVVSGSLRLWQIKRDKFKIYKF